MNTLFFWVADILLLKNKVFFQSIARYTFTSKGRAIAWSFKTLGLCPKPHKGYAPLDRILGRCPNPHSPRASPYHIGRSITKSVELSLYQVAFSAYSPSQCSVRYSKFYLMSFSANKKRFKVI